jgi:hypothetical protein
VNSLVGVKESSSAVPHEGQDCLSSGIACEQEGHFVMGGELYHLGAWMRKRLTALRRRRQEAGSWPTKPYSLSRSCFLMQPPEMFRLNLHEQIGNA